MTEPMNEIPEEAKNMSLVADKAYAAVQAYKIETEEHYNGAGEQLKVIKAMARETEAKRKALTKPLDEGKKRIMDFFRGPLQRLADAEKIIKSGMIAYDREQERKRREEEARLQELARKEQARLDKLAEKRAERAAAKGDTEKAEEIRAAVSVVPAPILPTEQPKVAGIVRRTTWGGEVTDKMELIKAVAAGQAPATLLDVNMPVLNQIARSLKSEMSYPGIRAVKNQHVAA